MIPDSGKSGAEMLQNYSAEIHHQLIYAGESFKGKALEMFYQSLFLQAEKADKTALEMRVAPPHLNSKSG